AIVAPALLAEARRALDGVGVKPRGRGASSEAEPLALTNILYCAGHGDHPHATPVRARCKPSDPAYRCVHGFESGAGPVCLALPARVIEDPIGQFVLSALRGGALADGVIAELERERADGAERTRVREEDRRRLVREIGNLEANLDTMLVAEVVNSERY